MTNAPESDKPRSDAWDDETIADPDARPPTDEVRAASDPPSGTTETDALADARAEANKNKEAWLRAAADLDNFKKRTKKDIEDARRGAFESLLKELLPVFDNLIRAGESARHADDVKAVSEGIDMILKQFDAAVGRLGIERVPTVGLAFDPTLHDAIQQVESKEHAPGEVIAEVQSGYRLGGKLLRAAMVVVSKAKSEAPPPNEDE